MKKRVLAALLAAVTCATFATSCGSNTAEETTSAAEGTNESGEEVLAEDQTLNLNFGSDPSDWDPCNDVTTTSTNMYINMYAPFTATVKTVLFRALQKAMMSTMTGPFIPSICAKA